MCILGPWDYASVSSFSLFPGKYFGVERPPEKKLVSSTATLDDTLKASGHLVMIFHLDPCPKLLLFAFG